MFLNLPSALQEFRSAGEDEKNLFVPEKFGLFPFNHESSGREEGLKFQLQVLLVELHEQIISV